MKNICILIDNITKGAGTERAVTNLANILTPKYSVFIFSFLSTSGFSKFTLNSNVKIIHLAYSEKNKNKIKILAEEKSLLKKLLKELQIDLAIGTDAKFNFILSSIKNIKKIGCEHFAYESNSKIHNLLSKVLYKKLDKIVLLTERDKKCYRTLKNTSVIPNSIPFENTKKSTCESKTIIAIGRLTFQKGFDLLLNVCCILKNNIPDWKVIIYGEGEDKSMLESIISINSLQNFVEIKPFTNEIEKVYLNSSIYVMTSRWEGLPMVLIEAQACGLPVVAYDCPCGPSDIIVENQNGFLCDFGDVKTFVEKITMLANNPILLQELSKNSVELSKRYKTETIAEKWKNLISEL